MEPGRVFELITIYDVHVLTTYKGEAADSTRIRMGWEDERISARKSNGR